LQARLRQGTVFFNGYANYYPDLEQELLRFPRDVHDDQVDALAWIGLTLDAIIPERLNRNKQMKTMKKNLAIVTCLLASLQSVGIN